MTASKTVISGVLLLNKPAGITSHTALSLTKRLFMSEQFDSKKAGHTGTLDPMATGLLPICFGEATKFSSFGLDADKSYTATIKLGKKTDTGDVNGQIIEQMNIPNFTQQHLDILTKDFLGQQEQIPPMYSALKHQGKKLYELARSGITIERQARQIIIHHLSLKKITDDEIFLTVTCSKGTYVRVLGETIAEKLGTAGHLTALHRTQTGGFDIKNAYSIDELQQLSLPCRLNKLLPIDTLITHLPKITLDEHESMRIGMGQRLNIRHYLDDLTIQSNALEVQTVRLYHQLKFLGIGQLQSSGRLQPLRLTK